MDAATLNLSELKLDAAFVVKASNISYQKSTTNQLLLLRLQQHNLTSFRRIKKVFQRIRAGGGNDHRSPGPSKFLNLPVEIRMVIYQYALGGNLFHIEPVYREVPSYPGSGSTIERWYGAFTHRDCKLRHQTKPESYHRYCFGFPRTTNAVSLLYTCKLINREAAMVPYIWNTFSFRDLRGISGIYGPLDGRTQLLQFASGLTHAQRQAVKTIQFSSLMGGPDWYHSLWNDFCTRLDDPDHGLPGVVRIYLDLLVDYSPSNCESHLAGCLEQLGDLKLGLKDVVIQCQKAREIGRLQRHHF